MDIDMRPYQAYQNHQALGWSRVDMLIALHEGAIERLQAALTAVRNRDDEDYRPPAKWVAFLDVAVRKLDMIEAATVIGDLRAPPGNRLEKLHGNRAGQWSIRINDQYRICFKWVNNAAEDVEIVDYH